MKNAVKILSILFLFISELSQAQSAIQMNVSNDDNQTILEWSTTNETNSSYFLIESSTDGINYSPAARVKAAGYSLTTKSYSYLPEGKALFYRVSLVHMDGGLSEPVAVNLLSLSEQDSLVAGN